MWLRPVLPAGSDKALKVRFPRFQANLLCALLVEILDQAGDSAKARPCIFNGCAVQTIRAQSLNGAAQDLRHQRELTHAIKSNAERGLALFIEQDTAVLPEFAIRCGVLSSTACPAGDSGACRSSARASARWDLPVP